MKLRVLISFLFVVATTFAAVHELEHIDVEHHSSSTCMVCIVDHNLVSADNSSNIFFIELLYTKEISSNLNNFSFHIKKYDNHSNAPPFIF